MTRYKHRCQLADTNLHLTVCIITLLNFEERLSYMCQPGNFFHAEAAA